jgi:methylmalonyl-CoA mutase
LIAQRPEGNLLEIAVDAARNRTTRRNHALETVYGRYKAQIKSFSGVYSKEINDKSFEKAKQIADIFAKQGRT